MVREYVTGLQHIGVPTNDLQKTVEFYSGLGFETVFHTVNKVSGEPVAFLRMGNVTVETWQSGHACGKPGAIDHVALDVTDVDEVFRRLKKGGYHILDSEVQFLPFWEKGVRFFTIEGPNGEKVEFSQML